MTNAEEIFWRLFEEASAARGYFHTWWALRSLAIPAYLPAMNVHEYVDFFHACNSGFLTLAFISLSKIFDRDTRTVGIKGLRKALAAEGHTAEAETIKSQLNPHKDLVGRILGIRNKSASHNQADLSLDEVYEKYRVTPDEIRQLINDVCAVMNMVAKALGSTNSISDGSRHEKAVIRLLEALERGRT